MCLNNWSEIEFLIDRLRLFPAFVIFIIDNQFQFTHVLLTFTSFLP